MPTVARSTESRAAARSSGESPGRPRSDCCTATNPSGSSAVAETRAPSRLACSAAVIAAACVRSASMSRTVNTVRCGGDPSSAPSPEPALIPTAQAVITRIAASDEGIALVSRGKTAMIVIVRPTRPSISHSRVPVRNSICPEAPSVLKLPIWASRITTARPLTKPSITGCGTMRISLPSRSSPTVTCMSPQSTTAGKR